MRALFPSLALGLVLALMGCDATTDIAPAAPAASSASCVPIILGPSDSYPGELREFTVEFSGRCPATPQWSVVGSGTIAGPTNSHSVTVRGGSGGNYVLKISLGGEQATKTVAITPFPDDFTVTVRSRTQGAEIDWSNAFAACNGDLSDYRFLVRRIHKSGPVISGLNDFDVYSCTEIDPDLFISQEADATGIRYVVQVFHRDVRVAFGRSARVYVSTTPDP